MPTTYSTPANAARAFVRRSNGGYRGAPGGWIYRVDRAGKWHPVRQGYACFADWLCRMAYLSRAGGRWIITREGSSHITEVTNGRTLLFAVPEGEC